MQDTNPLKTVTDIIDQAKANGIEYGIAFMDLNDKTKTFLHNEDMIFEIGSVIKICILVEVLLKWERKEIDLEQRIEIVDSNKALGSGKNRSIIFIYSFLYFLKITFLFLFSCNLILFIDFSLLILLGFLIYLQPGLNPTIHDHLTLMIIASDNTSTNLMGNLVGYDKYDKKGRMKMKKEEGKKIRKNESKKE